MADSIIPKLDLASKDIVAEKHIQLKALFPEVFTEGGKIDFDKLKVALGESLDKADERFGMHWAGKKDCFKIIQEPSRGTLKPATDESIDWEGTENLFIEGDNLEVLKLLQKSYYGKVKMIYIDPPYNTGKEFIYPDNYKENIDTYLAYSGQVDDEGYKFSTNTETEGRYHSNWLNMMYPRLFLARNLLREDGVIFISIDNHEVDNLMKLCNEIFGEENFVECITWNKRVPKNDKGIGNIHEFILVYVKSDIEEHKFTMPKDGLEEINKLLEKLKRKKVSIPEAEIEIRKLYKKKDYDRGITLYNSLNLDYKLWGKINMSWPNANTFGPRYDVLHPKTNKPVNVPDRGWRWKRETFDKAVDYNNTVVLNDGSFMCGRIWFGKDENTQPSSINYLEEVDSLLLRSIISLKSDGGIEIEKLFGGKSYYSYPKPTSLISLLINSMEFSKGDIVLDFFAGSSTTAHSIINNNLEDNIRRNYIMVQLPEPAQEKTQAYKAGFTNLSDISKERIRRIKKKITSELLILKSELDDKETQLSELQTLKLKSPKLFQKGKGKDTEELEIDIVALRNKIQLIEQTDLGFKVFKLDQSNFKIWDGTVEKDIEKQLEMAIDHINPDSSEADILYEILLKSGFELTVPITELSLAGKKIYSIADDALLICLEKQLTEDVIRAIAAKQPARVVCLDIGFQDKDELKTNAVQIMKSHDVHDFRTV